MKKKGILSRRADLYREKILWANLSALRQSALDLQIRSESGFEEEIRFPSLLFVEKEFLKKYCKIRLENYV